MSKNGLSKFNIRITNADGTAPTVTAIKVYNTGTLTETTLYENDYDSNTITTAADAYTNGDFTFFQSGASTYDIEVQCEAGRVVFATSVATTGHIIVPQPMQRQAGNTEGYTNLHRTVTYTIGTNDVDADFNFDADANSTVQDVTIATQIPDQAKIISAAIVCNTAPIDSNDPSQSSPVNMGLEYGTTDIIATAECSDTGQMINSLVSLEVTPGNTGDIIVDGEPAYSDWSTLEDGLWVVCITYIDYSNLT